MQLGCIITVDEAMARADFARFFHDNLNRW